MPSDLFVNAILSGILGSRGKKARNATRYLTGRRKGGVMSNPATMLTAAGLAWGVIETLERQNRTEGAEPAGPGSPAPPPAVRPAVPERDTAMQDETTDAAALRLLRLAVSAAVADGAMNDAERAAIVQQATAHGLGEVVDRELAHPRPLAEVVSGVTTREEAATLYVLAFTILRADEQVSGAERIYLARLAQVLKLDPATVQSLEVDTGARIDALGDQGQPGG